MASNQLSLSRSRRLLDPVLHRPGVGPVLFFIHPAAISNQSGLSLSSSSSPSFLSQVTNSLFEGLTSGGLSVQGNATQLTVESSTFHYLSKTGPFGPGIYSLLLPLFLVPTLALSPHFS